MRAKLIGSALLVSGLLSGCGGTVADAEEPTRVESREDALPSCNGQEYERIFYKEPEKLTEIGWWSCFCGDSSVWTAGRTSAYSEYLYKYACH